VHRTRNEKDSAKNRLNAIVIAATTNRNNPLSGVSFISDYPFPAGAKKKSTAAITPTAGPQEPLKDAKANGALSIASLLRERRYFVLIAQKACGAPCKREHRAFQTLLHLQTCGLR
jgi:hypothetical protein